MKNVTLFLLSTLKIVDTHVVSVKKTGSFGSNIKDNLSSM